ncbi:hypothetical protein SCP_0302630 [Sparassis crispa]|uniref:Uncharacterized protein n=1 Tax=Sparassis crispa TaxID=139825 RepID=A0A401GEE0_9APHY|nr:hypothetical protein SCP_0302630 [Sparassis crispa]GBE80548.1 hypothetical protein SCP_0302630 [Sparassis crispa]
MQDILLSDIPSVQSYSAYVLDKARKVHNIFPETQCWFVSNEEEQRRVEYPGIAAGPTVGIDEYISMESSRPRLRRISSSFGRGSAEYPSHVLFPTPVGQV